MPRGTRRLPAQCLKLLAASDVILHGGDFVSRAVYEELAKLAPVQGVAGNMDDAELRELLPVRRVLALEGIRIGMVHDAGPATGRRERLVKTFPECDAVVYGHTHVPDSVQVGNTWILNPGSPTERRSAASHGMIVLDVEQSDLDVRTYVL